MGTFEQINNPELWPKKGIVALGRPGGGLDLTESGKSLIINHEPTENCSLNGQEPSLALDLPPQAEEPMEMSDVGIPTHGPKAATLLFHSSRTMLPDQRWTYNRDLDCVEPLKVEQRIFKSKDVLDFLKYNLLSIGVGWQGSSCFRIGMKAEGP